MILNGLNNKSLFRSLTVASFALTLNVVALAEDDLMSILEGKNSGPTSQFIETEEVAKLKKTVGPTSAEQNIFFQFLVDKNYEKALFQWHSAFKKSTFQGTTIQGPSFEETETGKALESFLQFKNGLKITGVEALFNIKEPQKIANSVISLWKESLNEKDPTWGMVQVTWQPFWTEVFGVGTEIAVALQKNYVSEDVAALTEMIKKTIVDSSQRNLLEWQLVLNLGIRGEAGKAAQVLSHLMKAKNNPVDQDLMIITAGRLLYQNGFLDASINYYQKIPKKSDYWFQAQEEMAWAYMRKGEPQNAMAVTKTLTFPQFKGWVGIESYLLSSFTSLKVCDYPGVLATMKSIKTQFGDHLVSLEQVSKDPNQQAITTLWNSLSEGPIEIAKLGSLAHQLPLQATKDEVLILLVQRYKFLTKESEVAEQLFSKSLTFGNLQGHFENLRNQIRSRAQMTQGSGYQRVQELAKAELEDSKQVLQRLKIVEVEMIQQVDASDKLSKSFGPPETKTGTTGTNKTHSMSFVGDKELWFDELSNFRVDIKKGCAKDTNSSSTQKNMRE